MGQGICRSTSSLRLWLNNLLVLPVRELQDLAVSKPANGLMANECKNSYCSCTGCQAAPPDEPTTEAADATVHITSQHATV